jgi:hypothetical protein
MARFNVGYGINDGVRFHSAYVGVWEGYIRALPFLLSINSENRDSLLAHEINGFAGYGKKGDGA